MSTGPNTIEKWKWARFLSNILTVVHLFVLVCYLAIIHYKIHSTSTFCECEGIELIPEEKQFISSRVLRAATKAWIEDNKDAHFHVVKRLFIGHCIINATPFPHSSLPPSSPSPVPGKRGVGGQPLPTAAVLSVYMDLQEPSLHTNSQTLNSRVSCDVLKTYV